MNYPQIADVYGHLLRTGAGRGAVNGFKAQSQSSGSFPSFKKYLWSTYYVINMPLGADYLSVEKQSPYMKVLFLVEETHMHKTK